VSSSEVSSTAKNIALFVRDALEALRVPTIGGHQPFPPAGSALFQTFLPSSTLWSLSFLAAGTLGPLVFDCSNSGEHPAHLLKGSAGMPCRRTARKVNVRLPGQKNSDSHGARPVHLINTKIKWMWTSRLSMKKSLSAEGP